MVNDILSTLAVLFLLGIATYDTVKHGKRTE